ncbi:PREDICTED: zinc finger protein CONSTANS-LIKE 3 [Tarenaya hassleriana]|uniref:zinc finger protein CONSTANS-LIKE 3 n=1 Tax=Tarenaya hassleriana TaxID=28532 RepID=UPI00053C3D6C|nr:PREDICTED: zinc finger protein CONSTANS-LIKE 3 [Tarenaya hassleriana]
MASKLCDSCKSATATLFCRADTAFLCGGCDARIHSANKLASRHARVWICEVCEQAPAHVTCKADAAALCVTCDADIHSANPLARRHERVPVTPFYDSPPATKPPDFLDGGDDGDGDAEAASWLLPNPEKEGIENPYLFSDVEPYLDYPAVNPKMEAPENSSGADGVVPVQNKSAQTAFFGEDYFNLAFSASKSSPHRYSCISQTVSSSSLDVGVVPDDGSMAEIPNMHGGVANTMTETTAPAVQLSSAEREARVLRYREKRKNRRFEKTIRYASRKAYAEMRPRIKGRFAKRTEAGATAGILDGFGVVPTF